MIAVLLRRVLICGICARAGYKRLAWLASIGWCRRFERDEGSFGRRCCWLSAVL